MVVVILVRPKSVTLDIRLFEMIFFNFVRGASTTDCTHLLSYSKQIVNIWDSGIEYRDTSQAHLQYTSKVSLIIDLCVRHAQHT